MSKFAKLIQAIEIIVAIILFFGLDYATVVLLNWLKINPEQLNLGANFIIFTHASLVYVLLITFASQKLRKKSFLDYGLHKEQVPSWLSIGHWILLALVFQIFCVVAMEWPADHFLHLRVSFPPITSVESYVLLLATAFFGCGFREELFFRGYLMTKITQLFPEGKLGFWFAAIVQTMLFTIGHSYQGILGLAEILLCSIFFTLIYTRTKSLWSVIIFHASLDVWGFTGVYLLPQLIR